MTRKYLFIRQSINVYISVIIIYMFKLFDNVHGIEWDIINNNTGIFTRSINCMISARNNHVDVSNTL